MPCSTGWRRADSSVSTNDTQAEIRGLPAARDRQAWHRKVEGMSKVFGVLTLRDIHSQQLLPSRVTASGPLLSCSASYLFRDVANRTASGRVSRTSASPPRAGIPRSILRSSKAKVQVQRRYIDERVRDVSTAALAQLLRACELCSDAIFI